MCVCVGGVGWGEGVGVVNKDMSPAACYIKNNIKKCHLYIHVNTQFINLQLQQTAF